MENTIKIVTFNVRCSMMGDGINSFIHRVGGIRAKIREEMPDVIGFQEVTELNLPYLEDILADDYYVIGQLRNRDYRGEGIYTAVKKATLTPLHFETFWLSPTPYEPGSRFDSQSKLPRICGAVTLWHRESGKLYQIYNTHFDHKVAEARIDQIKCLKEQIAELSKKYDASVIVMGDFNAEPGEETVSLCSSYGMPLTDVTADLPVTFHDFGCREIKIDYIFVSEALTKTYISTEIWDECHEGIFLSDHYPVAAEFGIGN